MFIFPPFCRNFKLLSFGEEAEEDEEEVNQVTKVSYEGHLGYKGQPKRSYRSQGTRLTMPSFHAKQTRYHNLIFKQNRCAVFMLFNPMIGMDGLSLLIAAMEKMNTKSNFKKA